MLECISWPSTKLNTTLLATLQISLLPPLLIPTLFDKYIHTLPYKCLTNGPASGPKLKGLQA